MRALLDMQNINGAVTDVIERHSRLLQVFLGVMALVVALAGVVAAVVEV
jgi:hypothetical protein